MTLQEEFDKIDKKFAAFQTFLEHPTNEQSLAHQSITETLGKDGEAIIKNATNELGKIRTFYQERMYSANFISEAAIVTEYDMLYKRLYRVTQNEIRTEDALQEIENDTLLWKSCIFIKNLMHVCLAIAWVLPVAAAVLILPFALPVVSVNPLLGLSLFISSTAALFLSIAKIYDHLNSIQSTTPVSEKGKWELSFFSKINSLYKPDGSNAPAYSDDSDYSEESERSYDIFAPA